MEDADGSAFAAGLCLEWKHLNYYVPAKEENNYSFWESCRTQRELQILNDVSGHMKTGDLVAILGCSGAGKTTLLAAISQRLRGNLTGEVVVNGMVMDRSEMIRISSFLPQFEINVQTFTAYEHLYFMSHFKMHRKTSKAEKRQRVEDLLLAVGLRNIAHTRIQQMSGGERKRLSLAEELITDPPFIFCDEPTTGLDSYNAFTVIKTLRHLCTRHRILNKSLTSLYGEDSYSSPSGESSPGSSIEMEILDSDLPSLKALNNSPNGRYKKAIICSIHQPTSDIFELFTHIVLMDAGRLVYQGRTEDAVEFFTKLGYSIPHNCNPADFYLKTISDSHTNRKDGAIVRAKHSLQTMGLYNSSWLLPKPYTGDYLNNMKNFKKIWWPIQVYLLLKRFVTDDRRNLKQGLISTGFFMITSVTLAIMYSGVAGMSQTSIQDIGGSIFMLSSEMIFTFSYGVTYVFPAALPILRREVGEGTYSLSAYYVAVVLSFIPMAFFKSYFFFSVVYAFIYYERGFMLFLTMGLILSLSAVAATGYGLFLSTLFESEKMASECAAPFDLVFLIFGGAYYNVDSIPFLKYLSLFFYSNEALMYNFWIDVDNIDCPKNQEHPCIKNGLEVLQRGSFRTSDDTYWMDCLGLVFIAVVFNIMAYCFIKKYIRRSGYY
ncbi:protein brown isoform X1 [Musca domestica]|uniref:Protein brown n=2 Tax=Musca domestica TaxID=7370 RepID=A0A1I8NA44_MUSDO|nr:protein brown isoform X1 [Musca domestica]